MRKLFDEVYTAIDLETTGGRPESNGILEVGLAKIQFGKITQKYSSLINPGYPIPPIVRRMTGITSAMVANAPAFPKIAKSILDFIDCDVVVLHSSPFDLQFLNYHTEKMGQTPLTNPTLCTLKLGELLVPDAPNRRLETLANHLNIPLAAHHRAWSDAEATAEIFIVYLNLLKKMGIESFAQFHHWMAKKSGEVRSGIVPPQKEG